MKGGTIKTKILRFAIVVMACLSLCGCITSMTVSRARGFPRKNEQGEIVPESKPKPEYYWYVPLTVPADIVTAPFQVSVALFFLLIGWHDC